MPKLLIIAAIIALVWYFFRRGALLRSRDDRQARPEAGAGKRQSGAKSSAQTGKVEDMTECKVCGAYVPAMGASKCGRADCPF